MHKEIYDKLKAVAKAGQVTHYSEVAPLAGLDMSLQEDRNRIATILDEISTSEHHEGHPLLSVVVIHKDDNMPGQGFFTLARRLGLHKGEEKFFFFHTGVTSRPRLLEPIPDIGENCPTMQSSGWLTATTDLKRWMNGRPKYE